MRYSQNYTVKALPWIFRLFLILKNLKFLLKSSHQKKYLPNFPTPKKFPGSKISNPPKIAENPLGVKWQLAFWANFHWENGIWVTGNHKEINNRTWNLGKTISLGNGIWAGKMGFIPPPPFRTLNPMKWRIVFCFVYQNVIHRSVILSFTPCPGYQICCFHHKFLLLSDFHQFHHIKSRFRFTIL